VENCKDTESIFIELKDKDIKFLEPRKEDYVDEGSEEIVLQISERKSSHTMREEQTNKDIMMGSQKTLEIMIGTGLEPSKEYGNNAYTRGGISKNQGK